MFDSTSIVDLLQEIGHFLAAFPRNVKLSIPYFIPNITLGSFGAITQVSIFCYHLSMLETEKLAAEDFEFS